MDDFEEMCSEAGGKVEILHGLNIKACLIKDTAITEHGDVYPFKDSK